MLREASAPPNCHVYFYFFIFIFFSHNYEISCWRVCYQRGLLRQVFQGIYSRKTFALFHNKISHLNIYVQPGMTDFGHYEQPLMKFFNLHN